MKFKYLSKYKNLDKDVFRNCSIHAVSVFLDKPYLEVYEQLRSIGSEKFNVDLHKDQSKLGLTLDEYLLSLKIGFLHLLDAKGEHILEFTEELMPTGFNYIACLITHKKRKEGHASAVINGTIFDYLNMTGKPLIGIWYRGGKLGKDNWPGLYNNYYKIAQSKNSNGKVDPSKMIRTIPLV